MDWKAFSRARLVLYKATFLPAQLWFEQPNGDEITWEFKKVDTKTELRATEFSPPPKPTGWQMEMIRRNAQDPRSGIRPNR